MDFSETKFSEAKLSGKNLRKKVLEIIDTHWPIHPSDVCRKLEIADNVSNISKIKYHFDKLHSESKILTKKIDRALVAWPHFVEQGRVQIRNDDKKIESGQINENQEVKKPEI